MHQLTVPKRLAQEMIEHAREDAPNECCGILAGASSAVQHVYRARNIDRSPVKYTIDPQDMARIFSDADKAGQEILAFYHSHTFSEAYPSVTDVKLAPPSDLFDYQYVIVSLADSANPVVRSFRIEGKQVVEVKVTIEG